MRQTILVVDDENDLLDLISFYLENPDWKVICESESKRALQLAKEIKPDLVITDVRMPFLDGIDLLKNLKSVLDESTIYMIVTGSANVEHTELYALGAAVVMMKPVRYADLREAVERLLSGPKKRTERLPRQSRVLDLIVQYGRDQAQVHTCNLSKGGMFLTWPINSKMPAVNEDIEFALTCVKEGAVAVIRGIATVVWVRQQTVGEDKRGIGVKFQSFTPDSLAVAKSLLDALN